MYYLWTNLWQFWPGDSSPHSRAFSTRSTREARASQYVFPHSTVDNPLITDEQQRQIDLSFRDAFADIPSRDAGIAIVLTDVCARETARRYYVYYEPCAYIAIALDVIGQRAVLYSDYIEWEVERSTLLGVQNGATQLLAQGRAADALRFTIEELAALARSTSRG